MTKYKAMALGAVIAALVGAAALAQTIGSRTLTGAEAWQAAIGGPGGSALVVTASQMRNSQGPTTTALTTGTLVTTTATALLVSTTAAGGTLVVDLPPSPYDGQVFVWANGTGGAFTTGNTVATTDGSTIQGSNATGALAAAASIEFRYVLSTNTWYKIR